MASSIPCLPVTPPLKSHTHTSIHKPLSLKSVNKNPRFTYPVIRKSSSSGVFACRLTLPAPLNISCFPKQVLELPLRSQADVFIEDRSDCFRFTANIDNNIFAGGQVRAYAVKIHPGMMKVVVRGGNDGEVELFLDKLEIDVWRFRLPATSRPELATAVVLGRKLIVMVGRLKMKGKFRAVVAGVLYLYSKWSKKFSN